MTTIAWILIIASILLILFVVLKKFPALALLDVDSLREKKRPVLESNYQTESGT
jgi:hypothetical protein